MIGQFDELFNVIFGVFGHFTQQVSFKYDTRLCVGHILTLYLHFQVVNVDSMKLKHAKCYTVHPVLVK